MERRRVGILIFPRVEVLDFCGPYEVFSATRLRESERRREPSPFAPVLVAESRAPVTASGGMRVLPDHTLRDCPPLEVLLVPGGWGVRRELDHAELIAWIRERAESAELVCSVCTGAMLLGRAGLLQRRRATTHHASHDWMRETFPEVRVDATARVVEEGRVLTSAGIAAGIDLALRVVARCHGEAVARATARHLEYPYPETAAPAADGIGRTA